MRDWSERHIRELVRSEYKRMNGGSSQLDELLDLMIADEILIANEVFKRAANSYLSRYTIQHMYDYTNYVNAEFKLTGAPNAQLVYVDFTESELRTVANTLGTTVLDWINDNLQHRYFIKVNITGYFRHRYLGDHQDVSGFGAFPIVGVSNNDSDYYSATAYDDWNDTSLRYNADYSRDPDAFANNFHIYPFAIPLDAILPTKNPADSTLSNDSYMSMGIVYRYLTDMNNPSRYLRFDYSKSFSQPWATEYTINWLNRLAPDSSDWRDYTDDKLYFSYDTFIGHQVHYDYYKAVIDII